MSENTAWATRCRYAALANIFSVVLLAFALFQSLITAMEEVEGSIAPSTAVVSGAQYHIAFLFLAILTLLIRKRVPMAVQQMLTALNVVVAVYMLFNTIQFLLYGSN